MTPALLSYSFFRSLALASWMGALFLIMWCMTTDPSNWVRRSWGTYASNIEHKLGKMFIWTSGQRIAATQLFAVSTACGVMLLFPFPTTLLVVVIAAATLGPHAWLSWKLGKRLARVDEQVDGFLIALANALKSRPSIADAIVSVQGVITNPIRQEVELLVKQMRVGSTPEQALLAMSARVGSLQLDAAISAILVGHKVGGNVPQILETTAACMREMARLEGVVRTKTAEGKAQIWTLAAFPFVLIVAFSLVSPGYFDPLSETITGVVAACFGFGLWAASIVSARRILRVDI